MAPLPGPKAEPGTSMHPSGFSWLAPLQQSSTGNTLTVDLSLSHVLVTAVAGMVLVILVALPTQLLDSTLSRNETKIAKAIRRFLPSGSAARIETLSEQRVAAEQAAAAATVALANGANLPTPDSLPETTVDASQAQEPSSQKPATDGEEGAKS